MADKIIEILVRCWADQQEVEVVSYETEDKSISD